MIHEQQQEQASLYALGALPGAEREAFERELRTNAELRELVLGLQRTTGLLAMTVPQLSPPKELRGKVLGQIESMAAQQKTENKPPSSIPTGFRFHHANEQEGWKALPVPGAWIKLLSIERERGYAVLLGKLDPGVRYPAHVNAGPEDFCILTGDLYIGDRRLGPGDFHHADAGSHHEVNYSVEGCTLMAVLTTDDPLVAFAMT
jgi:anti-sigma factor ChrR (cupin superfamily)